MSNPAPGEPCVKCGQVHERCKAHTTKGMPCGMWPMHGQRVCRKHGGETPKAMAKAKPIYEAAQAAKAAATFGLPVDVDPATALLEEVCRTAGHVRWLAQVVAELDPAQVTFGATAAPNVWVQLYQSERKHLVDVCRATLAAGVEERRVKLAEQQGELLAGVIRGILTDLGVLDREGTAEVVRRHLMAVAAIDTTSDATAGVQVPANNAGSVKSPHGT